MSSERVVLDVSGLPHVVFGKKSMLYWGTLGFMLIEGFTLILVASSYLYLRMSEQDWPPGRTPDPDLIIPTINTILLLLLIIPMHYVKRAAERFDRVAVFRGMVIASALSLVITVLRWFDLLALNVRWDAHAYGSVAWAVVVLHSTLVLFDLIETVIMAWLFGTRRAQIKHYPDASDAALYQDFLSLIWVPLYLIVYWGPRLL